MSPQHELRLVFPAVSLQKLYERALGMQWHASEAIAWSSLGLGQLALPVRQGMSALYSDVAFAETIGVDVVRRIVEHAPEGWLRAFARVQVADELRHVQFFSRVVQQLNAPQPVGSALVELAAELESVVDHEELMVHLQVMELSAQAVFIANTKRSLRLMETALRLPTSASLKALLHCVVDNVGRDETRHVAFGMRFLRERMRVGTAARRQALSRRAGRSAELMQRAFAERQAVFVRLGMPSTMLAQSFTLLGHQLAAVGLETRTLADLGELDG